MDTLAMGKAMGEAAREALSSDGYAEAVNEALGMPGLVKRVEVPPYDPAGNMSVDPRSAWLLRLDAPLRHADVVFSRKALDAAGGDRGLLKARARREFYREAMRRLEEGIRDAVGGEADAMLQGGKAVLRGDLGRRLTAIAAEKGHLGEVTRPRRYGK